MEANLQALAVLAELSASGQAPTDEQLTALSLWSSWGAVPEVFEGHREEWADLGARVRAVMSEQDYDAARTTTMNAHYTDPQVAAVMWEALQTAGPINGGVLEPGCGSGTFMALAPEGVPMLGVELDPITARIAAYLNPHAQVRSEGFEKSRFPSPTGTFTAAIGNVPFGSFSLHDPIDNPQGLSIHNHFLAKAVKHLSPGGYAVVLTSSYTMDSKRSTARTHIAKYADLVGAIRLPTGAMQRVAGTDVVTDLLILRRREPGTTTTTTGWLNAGTEIGQDSEGNAVLINDYWNAYPEHVLGEMSIRTGQFGGTLHVEPLASGLDELRSRVLDVIEAGREDLPFNAGPIAPAVPALTPGLQVPNPAIVGLIPGHVRANGELFQSWSGTGWEPVTVTKKRAAETRALMGLRDAATATLAVQRESESTPQQRRDARARLNQHYETYVARYGPISRFELTNPTLVTAKMIASEVKRQTAAWRSGLPEDIPSAERAEVEVPEELVAEWVEEITPREPVKVQPHLSALRDDPAFGLVLALESFDEDTATATKTKIFHDDVIAHAPQHTHAATPADAIAISLEESRTVDLERIAALLNVDVDAARAQIADLVFTDPHTAELIPRTLYLAGDVRAKHDEIEALIATGRTDLGRHLEALGAVLPPTVPLAEVTIRPGVPWIPPQDMTAFCEEVFGVTIIAEQLTNSGTWTLLERPGKALFDPVIEMKFGTAKKSVADLWEATINNSAVTVTKEVDRMRPDGTLYVARVTDTEATRAARGKVAAITAAFNDWVHTDPQRAARLETEYNARFNSYVAPDYTAAGNALQLPGLSTAITPHPYQRAAVARILAEPGTLLDHVVGAGKTGTMQMAAMELRRTGVARSPWFVVPNHLVEQTAKEFATWYPDSRVMTMASGANPAQRRAYVARSAAADWDAVICPMSVFERINIDTERTNRWAQEQIADMREQLLSAQAGSGKKNDSRVKAVERQIKAVEKKFAAHAEGKDVGLTFESSGCDYLFVDEAHNYKNLARASDYRELACVPGSGRATDLDWKLRALREAKVEAATRAGRDVATYVPAVATFATGTPVANNLSEMWVMQHYLAPHVLDSLGLATVDVWAQQFTTNITKMEIGPDGSTWRMKDRVAGIVNAPELIALADRYTDRVTREDIPATLPTLAGGGRTLVTRPATPEVAAFIRQLAERANNMPSDPSIDNLLKITHEGRMIALDPRTLGMAKENDGGRIGAVAANIMAVRAANQAAAYRDHLGQPHATPGGLQLVFCDRSTPKGDGTFTVYEALAQELVASGMAREQIAFIHDAGDDLARAELFQRCRTGSVSVLIGSTEKMGTGTNVQDRAIALHHMDCPWRPADLEQREGRIIRQGNQNAEVSIFNYVTEGTYDAVMWQIVARKAAFIAQTKKVGSSRTLTDVEDDMTISAAAASAIATGDPRIIERAELSEKVRSLQALRDAHHSQTGQARTSASIARSEARRAAKNLEQLDKVIAARNAGAGFITTDGQRLVERVDVGAHIITATLAAGSRLSEGKVIPLASAQGVPLTVRTMERIYVTGKRTETLIEAADTPLVATMLGSHPKTWDPVGLSRRLENMLEGIETQRARLAEQVEASGGKIAQLDVAAATPFGQESEMVDLQTRLDVIDAELQMAADDSMITAGDGDEFVAGKDLWVLIPEADNKGRIERHDLNLLRSGDVVRGIAGATTVLHVVTVAENGIRRVRPHDDPTDPGKPIQADKIELVSRLASQLTPIQAWAKAAEKHLTRSRQGYYGTPIGQYIAVEHEGSVVAGTVKEVRGTVHRPDGWVIQTENESVYVPRTDAVRLYWPSDAHTRSNTWNPEKPGLAVGSFVDHDVHVSATLTIPAGTTVCLEDMGAGRRLFPALRSAQGVTLPTSVHYVSRFAHEFLPPLEGDLPQAELETHLAQQPVQWVNDLLPGDVVQARELDPKARLDRQVRVITHSGPGSGRVEMSYAPIEGGEITQLRRDGGAEITLLARRRAALTTIETLMLAEATAQVTRLSQLPIPSEGVRVWARPEKGEAGLYEGTLTGTRARQLGYSQVAFYTLAQSDGTTHTLLDGPALLAPTRGVAHVGDDPAHVRMLHESATLHSSGPHL